MHINNIKQKKSLLSGGLCVLLSFELVLSAFASSVTDQADYVPVTEAEVISVNSSEDPIDSQADGILAETENYDDSLPSQALSEEEIISDTSTDCDEDYIAAETIEVGQSISANFYDVVNDQLVPFYDKAQPDKTILSDIQITNVNGGAYIEDALAADLAYYKQISPTNPTPWLRIMPVRRGYQVIKWTNLNNEKTFPAYTKPSDPTRCLYSDVNLATLKKTIRFQAIYNQSPYTFKIDYHLDGGELDRLTPSSALPDYFTVETDDILLPTLEKAGYHFTGWYTDEALTKPVTSIPKGTYIDSDEYGFVESYPLYAGWQILQPNTVNLTKAAYTSSGTIDIAYDKVEGADGYEICFSNKKKFKKNVNTFDNGNRTTYTLTNLIKGTYFIKVRAYTYDSTETKIYSEYSDYLKCNVKAGVKEYEAKDAKVTLKKVNLSNSTTLFVKAKAPKRIKSEDYSYHLVRINAQTGKFDGDANNIVASLPKLKTMQYEIRLTPDLKSTLLEGCYAIAIKTEKGYELVSSSMLIANPEMAAGYTAPFPKTMTPSKKGLQGAGGTSALGVQHFFFNMDITKMLSSMGNPNAIRYEYNHKIYYFDLEEYRKTIKIANAQGLVVTGQIGMTWPGDAKKYLIPSGARSAGRAYYSLNFTQSKARDELEALFACMAETFSAEDCHLDNWVLGNEVNMHRDWYYAGNINREKFMANYTDAFRGLYYAVKGSSANARVYICLDHNWAGSDTVWGAKPFMDSFHSSIKAYNTKINWNLAYHPYPQNLANAATWNDTLAPSKNKAAYVTPKNLEVLTKYVKKKFGNNTRIILSEQGFTSNGGTAIQAAGIAYTFYKAQFDDMIDAVIFHRYQDDITEKDASNGRLLNYGICNAQGVPKADSYHVFKFMDSPAYAQYTDACLRTIGITSWKDIAPAFDAAKLVNVP